MKRSRLLLIVALALVVALYFAFDVGRYLSLDFFKSQQQTIAAWRDEQPVVSALAFFLAYVLVTATSLPGATLMTLFAGAIFGFGWALLIVSFAASLGATLAFLSARFLLRDAVRRRFGKRLAAINAGIARDGAFYLFTLRLVPLFPFFVVNLLMGLTPIGVWTYYWVSQVGMLAGTIVYVNAGTQIAQIDSLAGIVSPTLLVSFVLLGVLPLAGRKIVEMLAARKVYSRWPRPKRFDRNLVVIGGGSAGLVSAYIAAAVKASVTLVEKNRLGGDCLNTGCVPSKALIRSAKFVADVARASEFGVSRASAEVDFGAVMQRVHEKIAAIEPHDSAARYRALGVDVIEASARLVSPWEIELTDDDGRTRRLTTKAIVVATGARPTIPDIPGIEDAAYLTSETLWSLRQLPRRLLVVGGGPIGCELAQAFCRLGARVTQVQSAERLLMREDVEVSKLVGERFGADGIDVRLTCRPLRFVRDNGETVLVAEDAGREIRIACDAVVVAVGRSANIEGFGLDEIGVATERTILANEFLQTNYPNVYVAGDVAGPFQFTHTAAHQAWYAAVNALFAPFKKFRADYSVIPWATFIDPEVARVGINERDATEQGIAYEVTRFDLAELDRAITDNATEGFVKVLTAPGKDRVLGVTIVGEHAAEMIAEYVLAMKHGIGLNKILGTIHIYPTFNEANKSAAGAWKRAHAPQALLAWVERFHRWRR